MVILGGWQRDLTRIKKHCVLSPHLNLLLSRVMRNIRWIMWLTLSCSHSSCLERKERLISATESSLSSTLSDTEFSDSDWLSPESSTTIQDTMQLKHTRKKNTDVFFFSTNISSNLPYTIIKCTDKTFVSKVAKAKFNSTHMVEQTLVAFSELMQTAEHQPRS